MSRIYIATKPVGGGYAFGYDHLYIVYDMDENPWNGNESVLRVGPAINPLFGNFRVEVGLNIEDSQDALLNDSIFDRFYRNVSINGLQVDNVWNVMTQHAKEIKKENYEYRDGFFDTPVQNSNSFVASLLKAVAPSNYYSFLPNDPNGTWPGMENTLIDAPSGGYVINGYKYQLGGYNEDTLVGSSSSQKYVLDGGYGIDTITGNNQSDKLYGGSGNDTISGGGGNDKIYGGANNDTLYGGAGDDIIEGNENNDTLDGGGGKDYLIGGTGQDTYIWDEAYTGSITIDGGSGNDIIKLVGQTAADLFGHYAPTGAGAIYSKESSSWIYILGLKESPDAPVYFQNPDGSLVAIKTVFNDSSAPHFPGWDVPFGSPPSPTNPAGGPAIDPATIPVFAPPVPAPQPQLPDPNSPDPYIPDAPPSAPVPDPDSCPVPYPQFWLPLLMPTYTNPSPLIIDLDNDGLELTNLATDSVYWDGDNNGFKEATAWVKADDALLVRDWNNNGQIDDHSELFGTQTVDGFTKLTELDSNLDNVMNSNDAEFANLKIWQDLNQDGISQANELKTLAQAGIQSINLNDTVISMLVEGNSVTNSSTVTMADNSTRNVYDAWFNTNNQNSKYAGDFELDIRTLSLPTLRGYGNVKDLYIQMSMDESLLDKATTLAGMTVADIFDPTKNFQQLFKEMLYQWSGQTLSQWQSNSSEYADPRKFGFTQDLSGTVIAADEYLNSAQAFGFRREGLWEKISTFYMANFLIQTSFKDILAGAPIYNATTGVVTGATGISVTGFESFKALVMASADKAYSWTIVGRVIEATIGIDNLSVGDAVLLDTAIQSTAPGYTLAIIEDVVKGVPHDILGTVNADVITGTLGDDEINGQAGNDTMYGGRGDDRFWGGLGDDTYYSGAGDDYMNEAGVSGNDIFHYESGNDIIRESTGTDKIVLATGISLSDLSLSRTNSSGLSDLIISVNGKGSIDIFNQYGTNGLTGNGSIETIEFAGGSTLNLTLTGFTNINGTGNALNNVLTGNQYNNTLTGGDGNDTLNGNIGDDTLVGGIGDDIYIVDATGDVVTESASQGIDTVRTDITYTLGSNVENLTLTSYFAVNGTGNSLDNVIIGNSNINILTGAGGHDTLDGGTANDTMIGGTGDDIYFVDDINDIVTENASEGTDTVNVNFTYTLLANFENLTLLSTNAINGTGNSLNNIITGNSGINTLTGGLGNDTYVINSASDSVVENASEGTDLVQSSAAAYTLATNVESLTLIGTGNINGTGNTVNNIINGNIGNNTLDGGTGSDTLSGGAGDDVYIIDSGDTVSELTSEGTDTVQLAFTGYTLGANVENLTLTGSSAISATGNSLNNTLIGNSGVNTLTGAGGNDTLDGGLGNDTLVGGQGDDTYYLDTASDVVTENASEGIDTVYVAATYTLSTNLENLTLTGSSAINGTGNASDNILIGNSGVNTLTGANGNDTLDGGLGNDTMVGGAGDDIYYVDAADVVTEAASSGTDLVRSTAATYTLATNVENLILIGTGNISGTGNTLNNILTGNIGNNTLSGGTGNDTMIGGAGDDIYVVDSLSDVVTENANEGNDTVQTVLAYTLGANVENLTLTSTGSVAGTGNALNNVLTGNSGANTLTGGDGNDTIDGGTGNDTMVGGIGDDTYVMNVATDVVTENASEGNDTVRAAFTYTLLTHFENLTLTGTSAINATGNTVDNILIGNSGTNTLNGGTGNDTMSGGAGNDIYVVDSTLDIVIENSAEGTDLVQSSVTYILANNVENLTLTGSANINGIGNDLVNTITGNTGNNILNGGFGNDTLIGGTGDDTYIVDAADVVTEAASSGTDLVRSSAATYTLATNVENLLLTGSANISGTGNTANNILTGNVGNNTLNGGTGVDTLIGSLGDDTYVIDTLTDTLTENANEGIDTVQSTVTYTLLSNFENLTLTSTGTVNATGNTLDNILIGNTANNTLTGNDGNDTLYGLDGNDTLSGGNNNDTLYGGAGLDAMTGGAGADTFVFEAASAFSNVDTISDFTKAQADKLNIHDLLVGYTAGVSNIDDFVTVTTVGSNTSFLVDRDGAGSTYSDQAIATLNSITGLTVSDLFTNGHLIV